MTEGKLGFDVSCGAFCIVENETFAQIPLNFGDEFEVKVDENWVKTAIEITNNDKGELIFKLKNTPYSGDLTELDVRM